MPAGYTVRMLFTMLTTLFIVGFFAFMLLLIVLGAVAGWINRDRF